MMRRSCRNQDLTHQRLIDVKSVVVALALLLAACSSSAHHTAAPSTTTTALTTVQRTTTTTTTTHRNVAQNALVGTWRPVSVAGYTGPLTSPSFDHHRV
jgi:hypothetical protein